MMVISPSVDRMAYRDITDDKDSVVVINLTNGSLIAVVDVSAVKPDNVYFIDNDKLILSVSKNKRIRGYLGRHVVSAAFSYDLKTAELNQFTE